MRVSVSFTNSDIAGCRLQRCGKRKLASNSDSGVDAVLRTVLLVVASSTECQRGKNTLPLCSYDNLRPNEEW
jgi:hypothetical protein